MNARLSARFESLKRANRAGLVAYIMAGDPDHERCFEILKGLPAAGADVIELGFPFSDPMADGPPVQQAALRSLQAGGSLKQTLNLVTRFRQHDNDTPIILMGYLNPVEQMTPATFASNAAEAGIDGAILVDVPPEEDAEIRVALKAKNISLIRLATPTTDDARLPKVLEGVSGFLYYVSVAGVTGANAASSDAIKSAVTRLKRHTDLPIAVGFGVRTPDAARAIAQTADAVVVGSAFVDEIAAGSPDQAVERVLRKVKVLSEAVRSARDPNARDLEGRSQ